jgi:hypothetical protein
VEFFKGEKLDQMLLKCPPLCSLGIHNFIISLKHCLDNSSSIDCILKLKALYGYDYIHDRCFLVNKQGKRFICSKCLSMELHPNLIWFDECNHVMIYKMCG